MHSVEALELALDFSERLGYRIRQEWLGGSGGGACEFGGQKWIFVDLSLAVIEQLDLVLQALREHPGLADAQPPAAIRKLLEAQRLAQIPLTPTTTASRAGDYETGSQ